MSGPSTSTSTLHLGDHVTVNGINVSLNDAVVTIQQTLSDANSITHKLYADTYINTSVNEQAARITDLLLNAGITYDNLKKITDYIALLNTNTLTDIQGQVDFFNNAISDEAAARLTADNLLQSNLDSQNSTYNTSFNSFDLAIQQMIADAITARESGDAVNTAALNAEIVAREQAITGLSTTYTSNYDNTISALDALSADIDSRYLSLQNGRIADVTDIQNQIDAKFAGVADVFNTVSNDLTDLLNTEITTRTDNDTAILSTVSGNKTEIEMSLDSVNYSIGNSFQTLSNRVISYYGTGDVTTGEVADSIAYLKSEIDAILASSTISLDSLKEVSDYIKSLDDIAVAALQTSVDTLTSNAANMNTTVTASITSEATIRTTNDSTISDNIVAEAAARLAGDNNIEDALNLEISNRGSSEAAINASLSSEVSGRVAAVSTLQSNLDTASAARVSGDNDVSAAVDALIAARIGDFNTINATDDQLQAYVTSLQNQVEQLYEVLFHIHRNETIDTNATYGDGMSGYYEN